MGSDLDLVGEAAAAMGRSMAFGASRGGSTARWTQPGGEIWPLGPGGREAGSRTCAAASRMGGGFKKEWRRAEWKEEEGRRKLTCGAASASACACGVGVRRWSRVARDLAVCRLGASIYLPEHGKQANCN